MDRKSFIKGLIGISITALMGMPVIPVKVKVKIQNIFYQSGYIPLDGREISKSEYPELFKAIQGENDG